jgi:hypothetical protein
LRSVARHRKLGCFDSSRRSTPSSCHKRSAAIRLFSGSFLSSMSNSR